MNAPVVHLRDLQHRTSARFTLRIPDLTIGPGVTALVGPNGCGKTTLLRLLATVTTPTAGDVTIGGSPTRSADLAPVRRRIGYLPQDDSVPRRLTVFDHVDLVAVMREIAPSPRSRRALVRRALQEVGLEALQAERCGRLSGGERRRVAIAAALAGGADLLVLDEPDAHLDHEQLSRLTAALRARAAGATVVVASHASGWIDSVADRVVRLVDGTPV